MNFLRGSQTKSIWAAIVIGVLLAATMAVLPKQVGAATSSSLYSYTLDGSSSTIQNDAASNQTTPLYLEGNWAQSSTGVSFSDVDGNNQPTTAVGHAKPATGSVMDTSDSFAASVNFVYEKSITGCTNDSRNLLQIGRAGNGLSQIKLQLKKCNNNQSDTFMQCRVSGANSTFATAPMATNSTPLVDGDAYNATCKKENDSNGDSRITLTVRPASTNVPVDEVEVVPSIGQFNAVGNNAHLSVGNKYSGPSTSDQFVGSVSKVAVCSSSSQAVLDTCIDTEMGINHSQPEPVQWVSNQGFETNLDGWEGKWGQKSAFVLNRSYYAGHSGTKSIEVLATYGANQQTIGFKDGAVHTVSNTTQGVDYDGSLWVMPAYDGQKINLKLREFTPSKQEIGQNKTFILANGADWQKIEASYTALQSSNTISMSVYGDYMSAGQAFYADDISLVSEQ